MIEELKKAGIYDISNALFERYSFEPDLLDDSHTIAENLRHIIKQSLLYIHALVGKEFNLTRDHSSVQLFVFMTRQGVHIEIPAEIFRKRKLGASAIPAEYIDQFCDLNRRKIELVKRFYLQ